MDSVPDSVPVWLSKPHFSDDFTAGSNPLSSTFGDKKPFDENVEGLSYFRNRKGDRSSSVRHEICARETSESREDGRSCALDSKLP